MFFYSSSKQKTISRNAIAAAFLIGAVSVSAAVLLERVIFKMLPENFVSIIFNGQEIKTFSEVLVVFFISFFVIALIEELLKYKIIYTVASNFKTCNQIIDYIKLGIACGLGFATVENAYYFFVFGQGEILVSVMVFVSRLFLSTLAHIIYGAVMGYYLGHANFNKIYKKIFIRKSVIAAVVMHGFFNFLIFTNVAFYNVLLVAVALLVLLKWFKDRRFLEQVITTGHYSGVSQLSFSETPELYNYLSYEQISPGQKKAVLKKLTFCPYCLSKISGGETFCLRCKKEFG